MKSVADRFPMSTRREQLLTRKTALGNHSPSTMARTASLSNLSQAFPSELAPLPGQIHMGATASAPPRKNDSDSDSDSDSDDEGPFY